MAQRPHTLAHTHTHTHIRTHTHTYIQYKTHMLKECWAALRMWVKAKPICCAYHTHTVADIHTNTEHSLVTIALDNCPLSAYHCAVLLLLLLLAHKERFAITITITIAMDYGACSWLRTLLPLVEGGPTNCGHGRGRQIAQQLLLIIIIIIIIIIIGNIISSIIIICLSAVHWPELTGLSRTISEVIINAATDTATAATLAASHGQLLQLHLQQHVVYQVPTDFIMCCCCC